MDTIEFYRKDIYGKENLYIADPKKAQLVQMISRRKTIDMSDLKALVGLGFRIEEVPAPRLALAL